MTSVIAKRQKILLVIFRILTPRIVLHRPSLKNASYPPLPFHKQKGAVLKAKNPPTLTCRPLLTSCSAVSWKLHHLFTRTCFHPWKNSWRRYSQNLWQLNHTSICNFSDILTSWNFMPDSIELLSFKIVISPWQELLAAKKDRTQGSAFSAMDCLKLPYLFNTLLLRLHYFRQKRP